MAKLVCLLTIDVDQDRVDVGAIGRELSDSIEFIGFPHKVQVVTITELYQPNTDK